MSDVDKFESKIFFFLLQALSRPHDEPLPVEELDPVQTELESLLSSVALRFRYLKNEYESLDREDKRPKKGVFSAGKPSNLPSQTGKRKRVAKKTTSAKNNKHFGGQQAKLSKLKTNSSHSPARSLHTDGSMDATSHPQGASAGRIGNNQNPKLLLPKNDIPNKFWLSVEPYCMPITQEDIKVSLCLCIFLLVHEMQINICVIFLVIR